MKYMQDIGVNGLPICDLSTGYSVDVKSGLDFNLKNLINLKSASNLNGNLNCSKELEHYAS